MTLLTSTATGILSPEQVGALIVQPVQQQSIALQVAQSVQTSSNSFRIPIVSADGVAAWTPEGTEITPSDADVDEIDCVPKKLAALSIISRELATDSSPAAQQVVGESLARDIARKLDAAFFTNTTANGPSGIGSVAGVGTADTVFPITNTDGFAQAVSLIETAGAKCTAFVTSPATALALATLKKLPTGSNEPLLAADAASPSKRSVSGVPLWVSPAVAADTVWALDRSRTFVVLHGAVDLRVDESAYFSSATGSASGSHCGRLSGSRIRRPSSRYSTHPKQLAAQPRPSFPGYSVAGSRRTGPATSAPHGRPGQPLASRHRTGIRWRGRGTGTCPTPGLRSTLRDQRAWHGVTGTPATNRASSRVGRHENSSDGSVVTREDNDGSSAKAVRISGLHRTGAGQDLLR